MCWPSDCSAGAPPWPVKPALTVSMNVAPPTRTRSVVKNQILAAAYAGAHKFGVEVFEPATNQGSRWPRSSSMTCTPAVARRSRIPGRTRHMAPRMAACGASRTPPSALALAAALGYRKARKGCGTARSCTAPYHSERRKSAAVNDRKRKRPIALTWRDCPAAGPSLPVREPGRAALPCRCRPRRFHPGRAPSGDAVGLRTSVNVQEEDQRGQEERCPTRQNAVSAVESGAVVSGTVPIVVA